MVEKNNNNLHLYSVSQAAKILGIGRDTLNSLIQDGKIGTIEILKRKKIAHCELERFLSINTNYKKGITSEFDTDSVLGKPKKKGGIHTENLLNQLMKELK